MNDLHASMGPVESSNGPRQVAGLYALEPLAAITDWPDPFIRTGGFMWVLVPGCVMLAGIERETTKKLATQNGILAIGCQGPKEGTLNRKLPG